MRFEEFFKKAVIHNLLGGEKEMKKTNKIIAVLAVLIAGSMIASGALVGYLSNKVEAEITVGSPMEQLISKTNSGYAVDPIAFDNVLGGETVTFYVKTINKADASITGDGKNIVTNPSGVTDADFSQVRARTYTSTSGGWTDWYNLTCSQVYSWKVEFAYGPTPSMTWAPGQIDITEVSVTFVGNAYGTYTFTSQVVP